MTKKVLTSSGKVIDLDKNESIENLPPDSLVMDKKTYGHGGLPNFFGRFR
jgi:hypothetical protein